MKHENNCECDECMTGKALTLGNAIQIIDQLKLENEKLKAEIDRLCDRLNYTLNKVDK